ncbi:MAG TPA: Ig-like domain-containing protein [Armatimonadota bacterium]|nr:Ig-like domain-containing protein [Armatimonadota bacterium]
MSMNRSLSRLAVIGLIGLLITMFGAMFAYAADLDSEEQAFVTLINNYRQQNGLQPLKISDKIDAAATWMSTDMAQKNYFSHTDSLGRSPFQRMAVYGYTYNTAMGENIAAGNATASATFTQWKNSAGHNANMLNSSYKVMGIARVYSASSTYGWYWTNDFGGYDDSGTTTQPPTTPSDTTAPTVSITSPTDGATVSGTTTISVSATDNVGVSKVVFAVSNGTSSTDTTAPYSYALNTTSMANGAYTITATAYDAAGNTTVKSIAITVNNTSTTPPPTTDTIAPAVSITSPSNYATVSGTVTVQATATDNVGVQKVVIAVGSGPTVTLATAPYEYALDTTKLMNGTHSISAVAYDAAGNRSIRSIYVTVRNTTQALPATPTGVRAAITAPRVTVSWTPGIGGGAPTSYQIQTMTYASGRYVYGSYSVAAPATSYQLTPTSTTYFFVRVRAVNQSGTSAYSSWVRAM